MEHFSDIDYINVWLVQFIRYEIFNSAANCRHSKFEEQISENLFDVMPLTWRHNMVRLVVTHKLFFFFIYDEYTKIWIKEPWNIQTFCQQNWKWKWAQISKRN